MNQEETQLEQDTEQKNVEQQKGAEEITKEEKKPRRKGSIIREILIYAIMIVFCVYIVPNYVVQRTVVSGDSMQDTLQNEQSLLIDKISYRFTDPERYDIIVFYPKGREVDEFYVKRIYGLPGETVQIKGDDIYINGEKIDDPYAKDSMLDAGIAEEPLTLAEDEYFVLGDHRSISIDSRIPADDHTVTDDGGPGPVKFENIAGRVILRIWPLSEFGVPK